MYGEQNLGQKVRDISELVDTFQAQEGEVEQVIGKTGNGKTYEGTRRALEYLKQGLVVYTTWKLILPDYFDERESLGHILMRLFFFRKRFYRFDYKKNWHYLDIDREDLVEFLASLTDCIVFLDEGQDIFDARGGMDRPARKTITRTRHMRKTLIIISQRAQAVDITARANVSYFYKCVKSWAWFWPFTTYFRVYRTEEMDEQNYPIWEERMPDGKMWHAPVWHAHFANKRIYDAYNSWYLREGKEKSQDVYFDAYDLTAAEKVRALFSVLFTSRKDRERIRKSLVEKNAPSQRVQELKELKDGLHKGSIVIPMLSTPPPSKVLQNLREYEGGKDSQDTQEERAASEERTTQEREPRKPRNTLDLRSAA